MIADAELIENAKKPFELNAEPGDDVLIVTDTEMDPQLWSVLNNAARSMGLDPTVAIMSKREYTQAEPTPQIRAAMLESDVCVMVTSQAIVHSPAAVAAQEERIKLVAMEEVTPEILGGGAASADYEEILEHGREIRQIWTEGDRVTVTSPHGMDLEAGLEGRPGYFACGKVEDQPGMDLYIGAFPDGEASISPVEGAANGTIVWDTSMHEIGLFDEPIEADVEDGYVTEIRGGREADQLRSILENADDPEVYNLAEIAIGINPEATITGLMRQDKKAWGFLHLAVGANIDTGGTVEAPVHIDGIASDCTLAIDGETIVEEGDVVL